MALSVINGQRGRSSVGTLVLEEVGKGVEYKCVAEGKVT